MQNIFYVIKRYCLIFFLLSVKLSSADIYADVEILINLLTRQGCRILDLALLPPSVSSDLPQLRPGEIVFDFRKNFEDLARLSFNRALFYSYVLQRIEYAGEPNLRYYLYSLFTDLAAYNTADFSAIVYDKNKVKLRNKLGELLQNRFAPCADRSFNMTSRLITVTDCHAEPGSFHMTESLDMSLSLWRYVWKGKANSQLYEIKRFVDNEEDIAINFYGPSREIPIKWTAPYLVCSKFPKWYLTVTSPIIRHDEPMEPSFVAASMVSAKLDALTINQCSENKNSNVFGKTHRCKEETTFCEPTTSSGFQRGSYICKCKPGYILPEGYQDGFHGRDIELVTEEEYMKSEKFNCVLENLGDLIRNSRLESSLKKNVTEIFNILRSIQTSDCSFGTNKFIIKKGLRDAIYKAVESHFHSEIHSAWRLALFLGNYIQNNHEYLKQTKLKERMVFGEEVIGELLSIFLSHDNIIRVALTFDKAIFPKQVLKNLYVGEKNGQIHVNISTTSNFTESKEYKEKIASLISERGPLSNFVADLRSREDPRILKMKSIGKKSFHGTTFADSLRVSDAYYYCNSNQSLIWSDIPFYKETDYGGLISIALPLDLIDIDQCDSSPYEFFRGTHHCDQQTTVCFPVKGRGFQPGGYKCLCRPQFSNFTIDNKVVQGFDGLEVEKEYQKMTQGLDNNYFRMKCAEITEVPSNNDFLLSEQTTPVPGMNDNTVKEDIGLEDVAVYIAGDKIPENTKDFVGSDVTVERLNNSAWKDIIGEYSPSNNNKNKKVTNKGILSTPATTNYNDDENDDHDDNEYYEDEDDDVIDSGKGYWVKFIGNTRNQIDDKKSFMDITYDGQNKNKSPLLENDEKTSKRINKETIVRAKLSVNYSPKFIDPDEERLSHLQDNTQKTMLKIQTPKINKATTKKHIRTSIVSATVTTETPSILSSTEENEQIFIYDNNHSKPTANPILYTQESLINDLSMSKDSLITKTSLRIKNIQSSFTQETTTIEMEKSHKLQLTTLSLNNEEQTTQSSKDISAEQISQKHVSPQLFTHEEGSSDKSNTPNTNNMAANSVAGVDYSDFSYEIGKRKGDLGAAIKSWLEKYKVKEAGILRIDDSDQIINGSYQENNKPPISVKKSTTFVTKKSPSINEHSKSVIEEYDTPAEYKPVDKKEKTIVEIDEVDNSNEKVAADSIEEFDSNATFTKVNDHGVARFARLFLTVH